MLGLTIHLTVHQKGKLEGIVSINTSTLQNDFCNKAGCREVNRKNRQQVNVCELCYAERNEKLRRQLEVCLEKNTKIFSTKLLLEEELPIFNNAYVRFHSFGEFINDLHLQNFLNIAKKNPQTIFCLMTKRPEMVMKYPKLKNIIYICSSPIINNIKKTDILNYFDKIFTVFTKEFAEENKIKINCSGYSCMTCKRCYTRKGTKFLNEILRK